MCVHMCVDGCVGQLSPGAVTSASNLESGVISGTLSLIMQPGVIYFICGNLDFPNV